MSAPIRARRGGLTANLVLALLLVVALNAVAILAVLLWGRPQMAGGPVDDAEAVTDAERDRMMAELIDMTAGHPGDPTLPREALGASDEVLAAANPTDVADMLRETKAWAETPAAQPRHLFALGRAAVVHGYDRLGEDYLRRAADRGSMAALAYQGLLAFEAGQPDVAKDRLTRADQGGFKSAALTEALATINDPAAAAAAAPRLFDPNDFVRPDMAKALHDGDMATLKQNRVVAVQYLTGLNDSVMEHRIHVVDQNILREIDASLSGRMMASLLSIEGGTDHVRRIVGGLGGALQAYERSTRSGRSGLEGALSAAGQVANDPNLNEVLLSQQARTDGAILARLYDTDLSGFRKVYAGVRQFADELRLEQSRAGQPLPSQVPQRPNRRTVP